MSTLGELAASIAHEINQPLAAIVANANACLHWLAADHHIDSIREALAEVATDGHRAAEVIRRIRAFSRRTVPQRERLDAIVRHGVLEAGVQLLEKPFTPETLAAKVRSVLDRQQ